MKNQKEKLRRIIEMAVEKKLRESSTKISNEQELEDAIEIMDSIFQSLEWQKNNLEHRGTFDNRVLRDLGNHLLDFSERYE